MAEHIQAPRTIPALLKYWSKIYPETPAYIFLGDGEETVFSRGDIFEKAGKMASVLRRIGVSKGDVIAVSMYNGQNCPDRLVCELGIQMAGCVSVEASIFLKDGSEVLDIINGTNAKLIVTSNAQIFQKYTTSMSNIKDFRYNVTNKDAPSLKYMICVSNEPGQKLEDILNREVTSFMENVCETDLAMVATTSGTTSAVKYVPYDHKLLIQVGEHFGMCMEIKDDSRFFNDRSMSWQPGYPLYFPPSGVTRVMRNHLAHPPSLYHLFESAVYSHAFLTSTDIHDLYMSTKMKDKPKFKGLNIITGGQPIKKSLLKEALTFASSVVNFYGSTETGFMSHLRITNGEEFDDYCVGNELPDVKIKIVDDEENPVKNGQMGKILVKTPRQASGYLRTDGSLSREGFTKDGWFKIGDLGYRDREGRLYITGRGRDVILRGDDIIYPHLLEKIFSGCPELEDMAVVGVPDPIVHQEICLIVKGDASCKDPTSVAKAYADTIIDSSDGEYSIVPKYFLECECSLRNRNGKLDRKNLIAFAMDKLGISQ